MMKFNRIFSKPFKLCSMRNHVASCRSCLNKDVRLNGAVNQHAELSSNSFDVCIVGGGIVGLATAQELILRHPKLKFALLEKETKLAQHQTGHNSGVIHAGIYYEPGSLRAKLCVEGLELGYKYYDENNIPYKKVGKLIVAVTNEEVPRLDKLYQRGIENGVKGLQLLTKNEFKQIEPHCEGIIGLHSPNTGIVDYGLVANAYANKFKSLGGTVVTGYKVDGFQLLSESSISTDPNEGLKYPLRISGKGMPPVNCRYVITCGGLQSDRIAKISGCQSDPKIVPFRGDYLMLKDEKSHLVNGNIYPVPDPRFPFLGVHFTPRMDGSVWLGPNAVLAFKREGYKLTDFSLTDLIDSLGSSGLQRLILKHWKFGIGEFYRGIAIAQQVKQLQRFIPELKFEDVVRGPSGVRAQALGPDGSLVEDFVFDSGSGGLGSRTLHVRNAPSPGATSSLSIAKMVADKAENMFTF